MCFILASFNTVGRSGYVRSLALHVHENGLLNKILLTYLVLEASRRHSKNRLAFQVGPTLKIVSIKNTL
jgi:hypothetical protein